MAVAGHDNDTTNTAVMTLSHNPNSLALSIFTYKDFDANRSTGLRIDDRNAQQWQVTPWDSSLHRLDVFRTDRHMVHGHARLA
jgi:hypothetical protein